MNNDKELEIIRNTLSDTRFVLDRDRPYKGIKKCLLVWIVTFSIATIALYLYSRIAIELNVWGAENYFSTYRLLTVFAYCTPVIAYLVVLLREKMTLKEKSFLKNLLFVVILISLSKLLFPLSYYLNVQVLIQLYDTIPLDMIFLTIGIMQLYSYFKKKKYIVLASLSSLYIGLFIFIKMIVFRDSSPYYLLVQLHEFIEFLNVHGIMIILVALIAISIIRQENYEI